MEDLSQRPGRVRPVPYLPALDGLRAIAVGAVVLYHAGVGWMPGGFLGVDVFFVISGFLISSLLLTELAGSGRVDLRAFWARRFRRLLPALGALLLVTVVVGVVAMRRDLVRFRGDVAAAATYSTNWYLVLARRSYFDQIGRPSPLLHLWSLAVEEQFYLLWPLLFPAFIVRVRHRRRGRGTAALLLLLGALASTVLMAALFHPDHDPSRAYFGTDTRAAPLLVGAALAVWWLPVVKGSGKGPGSAWRGWWTDIVGALMISALIVIMVVTHDSDGGGLTTHHRDAWLYRGGFALVALLTAGVIAAVTKPASRLAVPLSHPWLRWVGERSYAIYLWHWPVVVLTRPGVDLRLHGTVLLALRLAVTVALAELSFRFVERPVRRGALSSALQVVRGWTRPRRVGAIGGAVALVAGIVVVVGSIHAPLDPIERSLREGEAALRAHGAATESTVSATLVPVSTGPSTVPPSSVVATPTLTTTTTLPQVGRVDVPVLAVGDSVMLGAAPALTKRLGKGSTIDAAVNRQFFAGARIITKAQEGSDPAVVVVVHLGNNGVFTRSALDVLLDRLSSTPLVILTRLSSPRDYADTLNGFMDDEARTRTNVAVLDWESIVRQHPDVLYTDHLHMRPEGALLYADAMVDVMATFCLDTTGPITSTAGSTSTVPVLRGSATPTTSTTVVALLPDGRRVLDRCRAWSPPITTTTTTSLPPPTPAPTRASVPASVVAPVPARSPVTSVPATLVPTTPVPAAVAPTVPGPPIESTPTTLPPLG